MNLNKIIFTNNACYKAGRKITVKGIMVHSTGANNPWLRRYVGPDDGKVGPNTNNNTWNVAYPGGREVCVHAFIGKLADGSVATYQTLPWDHRGWHAGGSANNTHIGFEICEDGLADAGYFSKVYQEAVELCAHLCKLYGLTEKDIICHSEGYKKGVASNHADVMHWFPKHGKSMDTFRADVKKLLNSASATPAPSNKDSVDTIYRVQTGAYSKKINALNQEEKVKAAGFSTYLVYVDGMYKVQVGAYKNKDNAVAQAAKLKAAGFNTFIVTAKASAVDASKNTEEVLNVLDKVKMATNATVYGKDSKFNSWVYTSTLYVREIDGDRIVVSTQKTSAVTGAVHRKYLTKL